MLSLPLDRADQKFEHQAMNCVFVFALAGEEAAYLAQAAQAAGALVNRLEDLFSLYREGSDVCRINAAEPGATLRVAEETAGILAKAMAIAARTEGAFHPFCGAAALGAKGQPRPPGFAENSTLSGPVIELEAERQRVTKRRSGALLDLGGIGKGFALDCVRSLLVEEWEIPAGLLVAGGSSVLGFHYEDFDPWPVRLADGPPLPGLANAALGCSGLGFQPRHIIDPSTSRPVTTTRRSCVHCAGAAEADGLATAALLLSPDRLETLCAEDAGLSLLCEDGDWEIVCGPYFAGPLSP